MSEASEAGEASEGKRTLADLAQADRLGGRWVELRVALTAGLEPLPAGALGEVLSVLSPASRAAVLVHFPPAGCHGPWECREVSLTDLALAPAGRRPTPVPSDEVLLAEGRACPRCGFVLGAPMPAWATAGAKIVLRRWGDAPGSPPGPAVIVSTGMTNGVDPRRHHMTPLVMVQLKSALPSASLLRMTAADLARREAVPACLSPRTRTRKDPRR